MDQCQGKSTVNIIARNSFNEMQHNQMNRLRHIEHALNVSALQTSEWLQKFTGIIYLHVQIELCIMCFTDNRAVHCKNCGKCHFLWSFYCYFSNLAYLQFSFTSKHLCIHISFCVIHRVWIYVYICIHMLILLHVRYGMLLQITLAELSSFRQ